jgi:hypothetical protein
VAFGDSFTYGNDVEIRDSWPAQLEAADARLEVPNYGVGGYGLDQALLRFEREGLALHPSIVLIGYLSENIIRHVNVFRPFIYPGGMPFSKPRFVLSGDGLELLPNPMHDRTAYQRLREHERHMLVELGAHDHHFQSGYRAGGLDWLPEVRLFKLARHLAAERQDGIFIDELYNPRSEAYRLTERIVDRFYQEVEGRGPAPVIVILPTLRDVQRRDEQAPPSYAALLAHLQARRYRYVDVLDAFASPRRSGSAESYFGSGNHYNRLGNQLVADHLRTYLRGLRLLAPPSSTP